MVLKRIANGGLMALLLIMLAACQSQNDSMQDDAGADQGSADANEQPAEEMAMSEADDRMLDLDAAVAAARSDLAQHSGIDGEAVTVVDARAVTWPNGAMGCPEEGMMYTQALVPGYYILLEAEGERHAYHAGRNGQPFHCPTDRSQKPPRSTSNNPEF
jgi:hypothetical protein